jgi:hypothetical protein
MEPRNLISFLLVLISYSWFVTPTQLDYILYSQIQKEIGPSSILEPNAVYNYYKLNNQSLGEYNEYLFFSDSERTQLKSKAKSMLAFAYDNYMNFAYPLDELDPIHCTGRGPDHANPTNININDSLGGYLLTLVESLTTLAVVGNSSEFKRATKLVIDNLDFDKDNTVQVFEATIR